MLDHLWRVVLFLQVMVVRVGVFVDTLSALVVIVLESVSNRLV